MPISILGSRYGANHKTKKKLYVAIVGSGFVKNHTNLVQVLDSTGKKWKGKILHRYTTDSVLVVEVDPDHTMLRVAAEDLGTGDLTLTVTNPGELSVSTHVALQYLDEDPLPPKQPDEKKG